MHKDQSKYQHMYKYLSLSRLHTFLCADQLTEIVRQAAVKFNAAALCAANLPLKIICSSLAQTLFKVYNCLWEEWNCSSKVTLIKNPNLNVALPTKVLGPQNYPNQLLKKEYAKMLLEWIVFHFFIKTFRSKKTNKNVVMKYRNKL